MNNTPVNLAKGWIPVTVAIALALSLVGYAVNTEKRFSKVEADIKMTNKTLELKLHSIEESLKRIEREVSK